MEMVATSPLLITNSGAFPFTPFDAVAVTVATPSDTPVALPVTGSMVAMDGSALDQVKLVAAGLPALSTAVAVMRKLVPGVTHDTRTLTVAGLPPVLGPPGVPLLGPD